MTRKLLYLFSFLIPFSVAINPAVGIDLAIIRVAVLAILAVWIAEGFRKRKINIPFNWQSLLLVSLLFLNILSLFFASNWHWGLRKFVFLISIGPLYLVVADVINSKKAIKKLLKWLMVGGFAAALIGILQFFLQFFIGLESVYRIWSQKIAPLFLGKTFSEAVLQNPSWTVAIGEKDFIRATSTFPDPHMLSFYLGILFPIVFGFFLNTEKKAQKIGYFIIFVVILIANVLTFSRGGYLGITVGVIFLLVYFWKRVNFEKRFILVSLAVIFIAINFLSNPVAQRFASSFNVKEGSNSGRLLMWEKALQASIENPFLGLGLGGFPSFVNPNADYRDPIYAHNTYLDISSEIGIVAALFWIGLLVVSGYGFIKMQKKFKLGVFLATGILIFSVHSIFETGIFSVRVFPLIIILLGLSCFKIENNGRKERKNI